ncbi:MAG: hypothetical protein ABSB01_18470 [Streptosporangiaceae bacterium]|jgi:hypothetical protein
MGGTSGIVSEAVIWRLVRRPVGTRGDVRQGAQQQAHKDLGTQQVDAATSTGRLHRPRHRGNPRHRGRSAYPGQALPGECRGALFIRVQANLRRALGFFAAPLRAIGVGDYHRAAQRSAQLTQRLVTRTRQDFRLHLVRRILAQHAGGLGHQPSPGQVNRPVS